VRCLCTPHRRTFFGERRRGYNQGSLAYFAKASGVWGTHTMRTLHKEANAKPRVNNFAKNDVIEGVGVGGVGLQREVGVRCCCVQGCCVVWV